LKTLAFDEIICGTRPRLFSIAAISFLRRLGQSMKESEFQV
jgi:hypothetical protein